MSVEQGSDPVDSPESDIVEVVQTVEQPISQVWTRLTQRDGIEAFLGEGATLGDKGDPWRATDGTYGVTRSYHPEQQVRVSWHADDDAPTTLVDLKLSPHGDGTQLVLRHKRLPPEADRAALTQRWDDALTRLTQS
ncbi:MAG: SRPBCC domain-containing protein [Micrococcales bacterium]|nr:SRPBCC domain-containing protein [Micrococcales bacterium]